MSKLFGQIFFVWHPNDDSRVRPYYDYFLKNLSRDVLRPMSRAINFPVFYRTSTNSAIPLPIEEANEKSIVLCFSSVSVVGSEDWRDYYQQLNSGKSWVIPIALDKNLSFNLGGWYSDINFIREYEFDNEIKNTEFLVAACQAILKKVNQKKSESGDEATINLFLSHAKNDSWALDIAKSLKNIIDNTSLDNFFDTTNIHASFSFPSEIKRGIEKSTLISIQSDSYSSRYWCQKEIHYAKEVNVPIVVVSSLKLGEDRVFPYSSNVPSINISNSFSLSNKDAFNIIESALLETLKLSFNERVLSKYDDDNTYVLTRPPEPFDLKCIHRSGKNVNKILYPDPPVYEFERKLFEDFGIDVVTPLTNNDLDLTNIRLGLSISEPNEEDMFKLGLLPEHFKQLSQAIAQHVLYKNGILVYGGDLRPDGHTKYIFDEANIVKDRMNSGKVSLINYLAWPIYLNSNDQLLRWKAKYHDIASIIDVPLPDSFLTDTETNRYESDCSVSRQLWAKSLTNMRTILANNSDARVFVAGKCSGYNGCFPGVLEEISISLRESKPIYLLGGFGGVAKRVCDLVEFNETPKEFTFDWQSRHNQLNGVVTSKDWTEMTNSLLKLNMSEISSLNGLSEEENAELFHTLDCNRAIELIFRGIGSFERKK
ncbi:hypothetical protein VINI7043_21721 [Vibrio nigripulchritudo ATCC 27043]|uniref:TIR domain-containing protein n=1 Tax=Vibrio nigripulchritudo TaxID=28173 RepID=UPI00021C1EF2|nr:TIR domain-containing protein [Vibrio nigripulchritudo]EGU61058.1 hypothetical protein VINI7043_21721 [Vibrio nigripulchritudo ATCC 27043]